MIYDDVDDSECNGPNPPYESEIAPAFINYLRRAANGDHKIVGSLLLELMPEAPKDSDVWKLLEMTGDDTYTVQTFMRAGQLVIDWEKGGE